MHAKSFHLVVRIISNVGGGGGGGSMSLKRKLFLRNHL